MFARRCLFPLLVVGVATVTSQADDTEPVKEKLFKAKKDYDADTQKFRSAVHDFLDKRDAAARTAADKKTVDRVKAERDAFVKEAVVPPMLPLVIKQQMIPARWNLDTAYAIAAKEYAKLKMDTLADATEKERQELLMTNSLLYGKRTFVSTLRPFDLKSLVNRFEKDTSQYKMNGEIVPHSIQVHPEEKGTSSVSYLLPPKSAVFRASVGIPRGSDPAQMNPGSPATFEVLGDGKVLWTSTPIGTIDDFQTCTVGIEKVKTLTLRATCKDYNWTHTTWMGPVVID